RSYEIYLAAYNRMRGRWIVQLEQPEPDGKPRLSRHTSEWTIFRDHGRLRLSETRDRGNVREVIELLRQPNQMVWPYPDGMILGRLQPSAQDDLDALSSSLCSPCYGITDGKSIPDFLRRAKTSVQAETLEGRSLYRLRGLTMDARLEVWIDPALGYAAR